MKEGTLIAVFECMRIDDLDISKEQLEKIKKRVLFLMENLWDEV